LREKHRRIIRVLYVLFFYTYRQAILFSLKKVLNMLVYASIHSLNVHFEELARLSVVFEVVAEGTPSVPLFSMFA